MYPSDNGRSSHRPDAQYSALATAFALTIGLMVQVDHAMVLSSAQDSAKIKTIRDGSYSLAQSKRGKLQYAKSCTSCHGRDLSGDNEFSPALAGEDFLARWEGRSLGDLFATRTVMPRNDPGSLDPQVYADIIAYLLDANGFPPGAEALRANLDDLASVLIKIKD